MISNNKVQKSSSKVVELNVGNLTLVDIKSFLFGKNRIFLSADTYKKIDAARLIVKQVIKENRTVYGINTGFGLLADKKISTKQLKELQRRIVLSHASGVGKSFDNMCVKLIMLLKINSLAQGYSGISRETIDALIALYNNEIYPVIPKQGSVGASGDLAPLAHMSMALIGEGYVRFNGVKMLAKDALRQANVNSVELKEKEGLALINGTQVSTAITILGLIKAQSNFSIATIAGALSVDALSGNINPFHPIISRIKRAEGQEIFSKVMRELLLNSEIIQDVSNKKVQDPYSLRCQPQVMGAIWELIKNSEKILLQEANAVSDNPVILPETGEIISGGNFHAESVAMTADVLGIACSEIGSISERRIALLIDKNLSGLPAFLVQDAGLNSGFMIGHVTAASLASENKTLAHPASVDSIPTSANQEDHVSMATFAGNKLNSITDNVLWILSIETFAACQGISFRKPLKTSPVLMEKFNALRDKVPFYDIDRYFSGDINNVKDVITKLDYYLKIEKTLFGH